MSNQSSQSSDRNSKFISVDIRNVKKIIQQLRIKTLALNKANHLIKILYKQVQILRQSTQQYLIQKQQSIRQQYQLKLDNFYKQNKKYQDESFLLSPQFIKNIQIVEQQIEQQQKTNKKQMIPQQNKPSIFSQPTVNKKYQPFININDNQIDSIRLQDLKIDNRYKQQILNEIQMLIDIQQQKMNNQKVYIDFNSFFDDIKQVQMFLNEKQKKMARKIDQMQMLIGQQRNIIFYMKQYIDKQSQLIDDFLPKLNIRYYTQQIKSIDINDDIFQIKMVLNRQKLTKKNIQQLQIQNTQLKQIVNKMIDLFQRSKSYNIHQ